MKRKGIEARVKISDAVVTAARNAGLSEEEMGNNLNALNDPENRYTLNSILEDLDFVGRSSENHLDEMRDRLFRFGELLGIEETEEGNRYFAFSSKEYTMGEMLSDLATVAVHYMNRELGHKLKSGEMQEEIRKREEELCYREHHYNNEIESIKKRLRSLEGNS